MRIFLRLSLVTALVVVAIPSVDAANFRFSRTRKTPPSFVDALFDRRDLHCGTNNWVLPTLIGGSSPSSACMINWPRSNNNVFGGPFGF